MEDRTVGERMATTQNCWISAAIVAFFSHAFALPCHAAPRTKVPKAAAKQLDLRCGLTGRSFSKGADYSSIEPIRQTPVLDSRQVERYIPQNMAATNDQGHVVMQIADRSVSAYLASDDFRRSAIGKTTRSVESKMQGDLALGSADPRDTQHKFKFQMRATNARALVDYEGFFKAQLSYTAMNQTAGVEVFENLTSQTNLVYGTTFLRGDTRSVMSVRLNF